MSDTAAPQLSLHSPIGDLTLSENDGKLVSIDWGWVEVQSETALLTDVRERLNAYFDSGTGKFGGIQMELTGTDFQRRVWAAMCKIPAGSTETYGALAARIQSGARAVGSACGKNPIPIIVPCHRVVASIGLGQYSGGDGTETKAALLRLEGAML
jgi:methylated-DNA-[protein]-cysteine S-methyltransferase